MSRIALDDRLGGRVRRETAPPWDLARILFAVVGIGALLAVSFLVVRPFLPAVVWAAMIVVATWPTFRTLEARLGGRRGVAVTVMTLTMLMVLTVPLAVAIVTIVDRADDIVAWSHSLLERPLPPLPQWIVRLPVIGHKIAAEWERLAQAPSEELSARLTPHVSEVARWLIVQAGSLGSLLVQCLLTVALAALLYARGEVLASGVMAFARRLAGGHGVRAVHLSAGAIRAVALGVVVTAVVQAAAGGVGLLVTGVPHPVLLTSLMLMLGVAQVGPGPVVFGATVWLYTEGQAFWGTVMLVWALVTVSFDNVLRPLLIRKGADLPLLLIIAGVVGGLLAFGLVGLFIGPVVLAVAYTLLLAWVASPATLEPTSHESASAGRAR